MPATAARKAFITEQWRKAVATTTAAQTRYGALARETADPVETHLDSASDAQTVADARQALLSPERRRFRVEVSGLSEALAINPVGAVPLVRYVDSERSANMPALVTEILIDLETESAALTVWG